MLASGRHITVSQLSSLSHQAKRVDRLGIVYDVILDSDHPLVQENPFLISHIGSVQFRLNKDVASDKGELLLALPMERGKANLPTRNEAVEIYQFGGVYYYRRLGGGISLNVNANPNTISSIFKSRPRSSRRSADYQNVEATGIERSSGATVQMEAGWGEYFDIQDGVHRLRLYEGDQLWETRFGQSLRFSAYNNPDHEFAPSIILRNRENEFSQAQDLTETTEEDVNRDGSTLAMFSQQRELEFLPGTVSEGGSSDFTTQPRSFQNYPNRLIGDQMLISSGRIILSARESEMIFYSKGNYGFISDGGLSIDNKLGITATVGDTINVNTQDNDINFNTGQGDINLGNGNLQPLVRGNNLLQLLQDILDAITEQVYQTPTGPTSPGPTNQARFRQIRSRLRTMLSSQNNTV